jgi:hypothetical protein
MSSEQNNDINEKLLKAGRELRKIKDFETDEEASKYVERLVRGLGVLNEKKEFRELRKKSPQLGRAINEYEIHLRQNSLDPNKITEDILNEVILENKLTGLLGINLSPKSIDMLSKFNKLNKNIPIEKLVETIEQTFLAIGIYEHIEQVRLRNNGEKFNDSIADKSKDYFEKLFAHFKDVNKATKDQKAAIVLYHMGEMTVESGAALFEAASNNEHLKANLDTRHPVIQSIIENVKLTEQQFTSIGNSLRIQSPVIKLNLN